MQSVKDFPNNPIVDYEATIETNWQGQARIGRGDDSEPIPQTYANLFSDAIASRDYEAVRSIINDGVLLKVLKGGREKFAFDSAFVRSIAEIYGGEDRFIADIRKVLPPIYAWKVRQVQRRLNNDMPTDQDLEDEERWDRRQQVEDIWAKKFIKPIGSVIQGGAVFELTDDLLKTAKNYYYELANELADSGHPNTAACVETLNDLLIPGSSLEAAIGLLPVGRMGGVARVALDGIAQKKGMSAIVKKASKVLNKELPSPFKRLADKASKGDIMARKELLGAQEILSQALPSKSPLKHVDHPNSRILLDMIEEKYRVLVGGRLRPPASSAAKVDIGRADYGWVQRIEMPLKRRIGERTESAANAGKKVGLFSVEGQDLGHLVPDVCGGDNAAYNFVRMSARVNRSYVKTIDAVEKEIVDGAKIKVVVLFETTEDLFNRNALSVRWLVEAPNGTIRKWGIEGLTAVPPITLGKWCDLVVKAFKEVVRTQGQLPIDEAFKRYVDMRRGQPF